MKFTLDYTEKDIAVIITDNSKIIKIPKELLPADCKEGDIFELLYLNDETELRRQTIKKRIEKVMK